MATMLLLLLLLLLLMMMMMMTLPTQGLALLGGTKQVPVLPLLLPNLVAPAAPACECVCACVLVSVCACTGGAPATGMLTTASVSQPSG
jgi:hypothetical protein